MPLGYAEKMGPDANRKPIGWGPYMISDWKQGSTITFVRNPHFAYPDRQYLDKIVYQQLPDTQARLNALKAGDIDVATNMFEKEVLAVKGDKRFITHSFAAAGASVIFLNTTKEHLKDVRVRRALALAFDRATYQKVIFNGLRPMATDI